MASITIGADPEFAFMSQAGALTRPDKVIRGNTESEFGIDGSGRVAELRPSYANSPKQLVANIKSVMQYGIENNPLSVAFRWKAGGTADEEPIGGHIHLGHSRLCDRAIAQNVSDALNRIVAPLTLMAEDKEEAVLRRAGSSYGQLTGENCWREQSWGMEYRVLSSWLTSPEDALSVLTMTYLVGKNFDNPEFMDAALGLPEVDNDFFIDCNKRVLSFYLTDIARVMKKAIGFKELYADMKHLFSLIINGKSFDTSRDMKETWGLVIPAVPAGAR